MIDLALLKSLNEGTEEQRLAALARASARAAFPPVRITSYNVCYTKLLRIFYAVEQTYETGQAIPVTGGQVMLK